MERPSYSLFICLSAKFDKDVLLTKLMATCCTTVEMAVNVAWWTLRSLWESNDYTNARLYELGLTRELTNPTVGVIQSLILV